MPLLHRKADPVLGERVQRGVLVIEMLFRIHVVLFLIPFEVIYSPFISLTCLPTEDTQMCLLTDAAMLHFMMHSGKTKASFFKCF